MNRIILSAFMTGLIILSPLVFAASNTYYSRTTMYFNVPSDATFQISMPADYTAFVAQGNSTEPAGASTNFISFNFTAVPEAFKQPYQQGNSGTAQAGTTRPIMYIDNTGNVNIKLDIKAAGSLPSGMNVGFNGTGGTTPTTSITNMTTSYQQVVASMTNAEFFNLTLWGYVNTGTAGGQTTQDFFIKSTGL